MGLDRLEMWELRLPLRTAAHWTVGGAEVEVPYLVLILTDTEGRRGAAEVTCRPGWNGMTPALLAAAIQAVAWPRIAGLGSDGTVAEALAGVRGMGAMKALCDNAWHDLRGGAWPDTDGETQSVAGQTGDAIRAAGLLTRAAPQVVLAAAEQVRDETGIIAFKVKLGQGLAEDARVLGALRAAMPDAEISGDANSAYAPSDLPELFALARDTGLTFLEDPCPMMPDAPTGRACASAGLQILADKTVESVAMALAFADRGVVQVSAKPNRIGLTAARAVAKAAQGRGGRICNGTYSESALGAGMQIGFAQDLPNGLAYPHEVDFHRSLAAQIAPAPQIVGGCVCPVRSRGRPFGPRRPAPSGHPGPRSQGMRIRGGHAEFRAGPQGRSRGRASAGLERSRRQ